MFFILSETAKKSLTNERQKRADTEALTEHKDQEKSQKLDLSA